jgi:hypothetical protein
VKLKKHDQELTFGSKVGLLQESGRRPWQPRTAECSQQLTFFGSGNVVEPHLGDLDVGGVKALSASSKWEASAGLG